jgi:hypothetical protein
MDADADLRGAREVEEPPEGQLVMSLSAKAPQTPDIDICEVGGGLGRGEALA